MRSILYYYVISGIGIELILGGAGRGGAVAVVNYYASFRGMHLGFSCSFCLQHMGVNERRKLGVPIIGHQPTEQ